MEKLRRTFTYLIFFTAVAGITTLLFSCQQSTNKQKSATNGVVQASRPDSIAAGRSGAQAPVVKSRDKQMQNVIDTRPPGIPYTPGRVTATPEQKKAQEFFDSGTKKLKEGDKNGAIEDFNQSITLYKMPITYLKRGYAEMMLENYDNAINDMNEAIKMNPGFEKAYYLRGVCRFEMSDYKAAEEDMKVFIDKDKSDPSAYNYLAGCRYIQQDFKGALENYDMVVKLDPNYLNIYTNRGMMRHYQGDLKGAVEDYDKALAADPGNIAAYNNRGGAKLDMGDAKGAMDDLNKAISLKKDYAEAYNNRGKARIALGDNKGACEDFKKALSLGIEASQELVTKYCK
jgi:tetratricopeptide (TPR) repeat protein